MAKKRRSKEDNLAANPLFDYFESREEDFEDVRKFECEQYDKEFYFLRPSIKMWQVCHSKKDFQTDEQVLVAKYWALACDINGNRYCAPNLEQLKGYVKKSMAQRGFTNHCTKAMIAMNVIDPPPGDSNIFGDDADVVDADVEGTFENEKKPSSSTAPDASQ